MHEPVAGIHDGASPAHKSGWLLAPRRVRAVEKVGIPLHPIVAGLSESRHPLVVPSPDHSSLIPQMLGAGIREKVLRSDHPPREPVAWQHVECDRVDFDVRLWVFLQDFRLDPPGPGYTNGSGRRQEQDDSNRPLVAIELLAKLGHRSELLPR